MTVPCGRVLGPYVQSRLVTDSLRDTAPLESSRIPSSYSQGLSPCGVLRYRPLDGARRIGAY